MKIPITLIVGTMLLVQLKAQWTESVIDEGLNRATVMCASDIDDDGDEDIIAALFGQTDIVCYTNNNNTLTKEFIDTGIGAVGVIAVDIDLDGKKDILVAGHSSNVVKFYKNMGGTPIEWSPILIGSGLSGAEFADAGDIDNDGDIDVVATAAKGNKVVWYENDGTSENWQEHLIVDNITLPLLCQITDLNNDGKTDVIVNSMNDNKIVWYNSQNNFEYWTEHEISDNIIGTSGFSIVDIDNDKDIDIVAVGNSNQVIFFENLGGDTVIWDSYLIDDNLSSAFSVFVADMDNDDRMDILATGSNSGKVVYYRNAGGDSPIDWEKTEIKSGLSNAWDVRACDIDSDSDKDIIINQFITNGKILCYLNPLVPNSVNDNSILQKVKVYPNPSEGIFTIAWNTPHKTSVNIYDLQGRIIKVIHELKSSEFLIDLSSFAKGMYMIELINEKNSQTTKLVIR